jgi:predicted DNA-binding transcriptional regulator AlpA
MRTDIPQVTHDSMPAAIGQLMEQVAHLDSTLDAVTKADPTRTSEFLNADEAAAMLQMSKQSLYFKTMNRTVPHHKRGKRLYFDRSELIAFIREGRVTTSKERTEANTEKK